jgi:hypothetical protein
MPINQHQSNDIDAGNGVDNTVGNITVHQTQIAHQDGPAYDHYDYPGYGDTINQDQDNHIVAGNGVDNTVGNITVDQYQEASQNHYGGYPESYNYPDYPGYGDTINQHQSNDIDAGNGVGNTVGNITVHQTQFAHQDGPGYDNYDYPSYPGYGDTINQDQFNHIVAGNGVDNTVGNITVDQFQQASQTHYYTPYYPEYDYSA